MISLLRRAWWIGITGAGLALLAAGCAGHKPVPQPEPPVQAANPIPAGETATNSVQLQRVRPVPPVNSSDTIASNLLAWDAVFKEYRGRLGETNAQFTFRMTNVSAAPITIYATSTSCECTVAKLPTSPWTVPPGGQGKIQAMVELPQMESTITNYIVIFTSKGNKLLLLKTTVAKP